MKSNLKVLGISYGRNLFDANDVEHKRMAACAQQVAELHLIVFTLYKDNLKPYQNGNFYVHPSNSKSKFHMLWDAYQIGKKILLSQTEHQFVMTAQDPFETAVVATSLARKFKLPLNIQEHGDFYSSPYWKQDTFLNRVRFVVGKYLLRKADSVRVVSDRIGAAMEKQGIAKRRILKLPVRSDMARIPLQNQVTTATQKPDLIIGLGRLVTQKNFPLLISAFFEVQKQIRNARLQIVGSGPEERQLRSLVIQLGISEKVEFIPWTTKPLELLNGAKVFALTSDWEGWGRVLVEAMSVGTPIITTDVGCAGEVVKDGVHGYVVPVRDTQAFTKRLVNMLEDEQLYQQFSQNELRDVAATHVSIESYTAAWVEVLQKTAEFKY